jgi:hypothetical protein
MNYPSKACSQPLRDTRTPNTDYAQYEYQNPADNVALAIYRDEASAQRALDASPIRFALEKLTSTPDTDPNQSFSEVEEEEEDDVATLQVPIKQGIDEILRPSQIINRTLPSTPSTPPSPTPKPTPMPFDPPNPPPGHAEKKSTRWFQVTVDRSRAVHQDFVERQPFWKQFTPMKSMAQEDLAKDVPHLGLSDVSKRPPNAHRTPNRVLRVMNEYVETRMPTLRGMVEGSEGERGFVERRTGRE